MKPPILSSAVLLSILCPGLASAQGDMLVVTRGADTISVERLQRSPTRLDGELVIRPAKVRFSYALTMSPDGRAMKLENHYRRADADAASRPLQIATLLFMGDSVIVDIDDAGSGQKTQRFGSKPGAMPYLNPSFALLEPVLARMQRSRSDSLDVPFFFVQGGQTLMVGFRRISADSVLVRFAPGQDARLAIGTEGQVRGGGIASQGLVISRAVATGAAFFVPKPDYSAPAGAPYTADQVTVKTPMGHTLAGTFTRPKGKGPFPAIVTITGSGSQDRDEEISLVKGFRPFRQIADTLSRMGIAVLRMDDRGFGESGGNATIATSADFAKDIEAGLAWLRARQDIDGKRLGVVGHSEGGLIAPMVAVDDPSLRAMVLMAGPAQTGRTIITFQNRYAIEHSPTIRAEARDSALTAAMQLVDSMAATGPWLKFFLDYDPIATAKRVKVATLILQGATDQQVTAEQANALAAAIRSGGNQDVTVKVFPDANHLFVQDPSGNPSGYTSLATGQIRGDVIATLTEWLGRKLAGRR
jgi:dienelactone hydrolase